MKLLVCRNCFDTIALTTHRRRSCRCRRTSGRYRADGHTADVRGPCIAIGVHSGDIAVALRRNGDADIRAFVIPDDAPTLIRDEP